MSVPTLLDLAKLDAGIGYPLIEEAVKLAPEPCRPRSQSHDRRNSLPPHGTRFRDVHRSLGVRGSVFMGATDYSPVK